MKRRVILEVGVQYTFFLGEKKKSSILISYLLASAWLYSTALNMHIKRHGTKNMGSQVLIISFVKEA